MDFQGALHARLVGAGTDAAGSVAWQVMPQRKARPAIILTVIDDERTQHLKGFNGRRGTRVQIDCQAETHASATALADQAIAAIAQPGEVEGVRFGAATDIFGPRDLGDDETGKFIFRQVIDAIIWHNAGA